MLSIVGICFIILSFVMAALSIGIGIKSLQKKKSSARVLTIACCMAALVQISYCLSVLSTNYFVVAVLSSIYFCSIDLSLLAFFIYVIFMTKVKRTRVVNVIMTLVTIFVGTDVLIELVNPYQEICIHFVERDTVFSHYSYEMLPLYDAHLYLDYAMIVMSIGFLLHKAFSQPTEYRRPYTQLSCGIIVIVLLNITFLYFPALSFYNILDYSVLLYSLICAFSYWNEFSYTTHKMMNQFKMTIFNNINQGIVLFDNEDMLMMVNEKMEKTFPDIAFSEKMDVNDFCEQCGIAEFQFDKNQRHSVQCYIQADGMMRPILCDYHPIRGKSQKVIAQMYVLTRVTRDIDPLTGFHNWDSFQHMLEKNVVQMEYPVTAVMLDINNLSEINHSRGRTAGDQAIRDLSKMIAKTFPSSTYLVRERDAHLLAICSGTVEKEVHRYVTTILEQFEESLQYGMGMSDGEQINIFDAVESSSKSLRIKKLLDQSSQKSGMLTSLVRALQECDEDTEEHVMRTQQMGHLLGEKIDLSDLELSEVRLLCLLHDIGKIGIPLEILNKPGKLNSAEWRVLKAHTEKGYQIAMSNKELKEIAPMILYHHERWDGHGYPKGLKGEEIPLLSRLISVVDSYDAMVNDRSYRAALPREKAIAELKRCSGTQFDPNMVEKFLELLDEIGEQEVYHTKTLEGPPAYSKHKNEEKQEENPFIREVIFSKYTLDDKMFIEECDDNFEKLTGYTRDEVKTMRLKQEELLPEEDRLLYLKLITQTLSRSPMAYFKHRIMKKDGSIIEVNCFGRMYFDSADKVTKSEIIISQADQRIATQHFLMTL